MPSLLFFLLPFPAQIFIFLINVVSSFGAPHDATRPIIFKIKDPSHSFDHADFCSLFHLPSLGYSTSLMEILLLHKYDQCPTVGTEARPLLQLFLSTLV